MQAYVYDTTGSRPIITDLRHQEAGTRFVLMREDTTLSRNLSAQICKATGAQHYEQEDDQMALGGIIADVMGLGKTLTTLASILRSSEKALDFAFASPALCQPKSDISRMKATLVVVPSARKSEGPGHRPIKDFSTADASYRAFRELGI